MLTTAPPTHLEMLSLSDMKTVLGCTIRVLLDSERTRDIMTAEELTAQKQLHYLLARGVFDTPEGRDLLADRPDMAGLDLEALGALAKGSLGHELAAFFDRNQITTDVYSVPTEYTDDPTAAFLMRRIRQSHDIWHVLMGFGVRGHEEILVHAFSLAQTGLPVSVALMALGSLKHMVLEARWACIRTGVRRAYERGRHAAPLLAVYWERYWETPVEELRQMLRIEPWSAQDHAACEPWRFRMAA